MPQVSLDEWKTFVARHPEAHILQTAEWGELKADFGWDAVRLICGDVGAQVLFRRLPLGWSLAYVPKPMFDIWPAAVQDGFWSELNAILKRRGAVFLKIEPDAWEDPESSRIPHAGPDAVLGSTPRPSAYSIQPRRTIVIDLRGTEEGILGRMKQKCRYNIHLAEKKGVQVQSWDDLEAFHQLVQFTGGRDGFAVHSMEYYRRAYQLFHAAGLCELLVARYEDQPLAALMVFRHGNRAWYLYGASNDKERNRMPTYVLQWEAMRWAKTRGCDQYDLWGVPDEDESFLEQSFEGRQDGLWGVYRFKRGFGGELRRAAPAVDVVLNPLLYRLYLWRMAGRETG